MKKIFIFILFISISFVLGGSGYKGTLPDLGISKDNSKTKPVEKTELEILPLDKLTIPIKNTKPIDKIGDKYTQDLGEAIKQLERIKEILDNNKSFKNFVAAANVLDLTTTNILNEFHQERFAKSNKLLDDINYDTQQIKTYWIQINKNAPYVSHYKTKGAYSGENLNKQLNNFSRVLGHAIREIKSINF